VTKRNKNPVEVSPHVLENKSKLAATFSNGKPFPHVVIEDFLSDAFCSEIIAQFPDFDERSAINEDGQVGGKSTRERVRELGPAYARLDDLMRSREFLGLVGGITGIRELKYDPWYFGGGTHENRHGQDLDPHIDFNYHPISGQHRRLNLIIYLNEEWDDAWGGLLQLHKDPYSEPGNDQIVTVSPRRNRCVIFETSERSWHGFERIQLPQEKRQISRKSFAVYFYSKQRPASETADEHSTVYVERHLPERYVPGLTLGEEHIREIEGLLKRRDSHLKRLYREVQTLRAALNRSWIRQVGRGVRRLVYRPKR
jgi:hypothetical protein